MEIIISLKNTERGILLVATDKNIMGRKFEEGKYQLDLTKEFYNGMDLKDEEELSRLAQSSRYLHLTGKEAVSWGIEEGFVQEKRVLTIESVPHAEVVIEE